MQVLNKHKTIFIISFVFAVIYALISLVNHYNFRTYALDLGLYTNAAFNYAHGQLGNSNMIKDYYEPILGTHFDLYLLLFSPFTYLLGSYTLLIIQIAALIAGGVGVYYYFSLSASNKQQTPYLAATYFYIFFGVFGAVSYDYHSVVIAASLVPWFFVAIYCNRKLLAIFLLLFMIISQENFALFLFFICLGLIIEYRHNTKMMLHLLLLSVISLVYFLSVLYYIIPYFSPHKAYQGLSYSYFGNSINHIIKTLINNPVNSFKLLFINHKNIDSGNFVKAEAHLILVASGLPILLKKPQYLFMLIPIYFQKFYHDSYAMWGIGGQYNIEFTPVLAIGIFKAISDFKNKKTRLIVSAIVLLTTTVATFRIMDNTVLWTDKSRIRFYQMRHYKRNYDVKSVHWHIHKIPDSVAVSAQAAFVPHLALRSKIYQFPVIKDADYIIYSPHEGTYPLTNNEFLTKINDLENSSEWKIHYKGIVTILKRTSK